MEGRSLQTQGISCAKGLATVAYVMCNEIYGEMQRMSTYDDEKFSEE